MDGLVVFDLDGTLLRTHIHSCAAAHETLARLGLPDVADEAVERLIGEPPEVFFASLAPGYRDMAALEAMFDECEQMILMRRGALYDGVAALLEQLTKDVYSIAVCSNGSRAYVELALDVTGIRAYFSLLACAGEFTEKGQAVERMIRSCNCAFAIMVGDGAHDAKAARDNGIPFIAAGYGYGGYEDTCKPDFLANSADEIYPLIDQIRRSQQE